MNGRDEHGAATVVATALLGVLLLCGAGLGVVAAVVVAHRQAQSAADLAALAGAQAVRAGGSGCAAAGDVAAANRARLAACVVEAEDVLVRVEVAGPHWLGLAVDPVAEARAGPG